MLLTKLDIPNEVSHDHAIAGVQIGKYSEQIRSSSGSLGSSNECISTRKNKSTDGSCTLSSSESKTTVTGAVPPSRAEQLFIGQTRVLGKFATRYLEHIENKLESKAATDIHSDQDESRFPAGRELPKSSKGKLEQGTLNQELLSQEETVAGSLQGKLSNALVSQINGTGLENQNPTVGIELPREPSLVAVFQDIIADLDRLNETRTIGKTREASRSRPNRSVRSTAHRVRSMTCIIPSDGAHETHGLQTATVSSSSCLNLTTPERNPQANELSVADAFDQLDRVVDDLLELVSAGEASV